MARTSHQQHQHMLDCILKEDEVEQHWSSTAINTHRPHREMELDAGHMHQKERTPTACATHMRVLVATKAARGIDTRRNLMSCRYLHPASAAPRLRSFAVTFLAASTWMEHPWPTRWQ